MFQILVGDIFGKRVGHFSETCETRVGHIFCISRSHLLDVSSIEIYSRDLHVSIALNIAVLVLVLRLVLPVLVLAQVLRPKTMRHGTSCVSKYIVNVIRGDRKPYKTHDSERVKTKHLVNRKENVQLQGCAMPSLMSPCRVGWTRGFCTVWGWSRHDLAMTWERYDSVLHVFYMLVGDFRPKLEVHMHVQHADFYACLRRFAVLCSKLPDVPCLLVPGSSWGERELIARV
jgi:hypothetical protein